MSIKKEKLTKDQVCGLCREYSPRGYVIKDVGVGPRICTTYTCARETFEDGYLVN